MPTTRALALVVALALAPNAEAAASDPPAPLVVTSHEVQVRFVDGVARLTARRTFKNEGEAPRELELSALSPDGAAGAGLRIRAGRRWIAGELLPAAAARQRYQHLRSRGDGAPKRIALLEWCGEGSLCASAFPAQRGAIEIEIAYVAPLDYRQGRYVVRYPWWPEDEPPPALRVDPTSFGGAAEIDGQRVARGAWIRTSAPVDDAPAWDEEPGVEVTVVAPPIHGLTGRLGRAVTSEGTTILRMELEAAPKITARARSASVVFVVDVSWSQSEDELERSLAIPRAYARLAPDAEIELVAFHRRAERVFGRFVPAAGLDEALAAPAARERLRQANGSALEGGLAVAASALRRRSGPRRIVAITDALLRERFTAAIGEAAAMRAPADTILHVVVARPGDEPEMLRRDDAHPLASIAARRGGVLYHAEAEYEDETQVGLLDLVRPTAIDNLALEGASVEGLDLPPLLREGEGHRVMTGVTDAPSRIVVVGERWRAPVRLVLAESRPFNAATAGFAVAEPRRFYVSVEEIAELARAAGVVSSTTSYLAVEPRAAPSTLGLVEPKVTKGGGGGGGWGRGPLPTGTPFAPRARDRLDALVRGGVEACRRRHSPADAWHLHVDVETTYQEIVDVTPGRDALDAMDQCVVEAIWDVRIPWVLTARRARHRLELPAPGRRVHGARRGAIEAR
ncbi:MAG: VWA domain-containing protein [Nannocystaceae bacterium]